MARDNKLRKVLNSILAAEPLFISGTGTKVIVTDIDYNKGQREVIARIKLIDPPDKKTILKCEQFNIDVRETNSPANSLGQAPVPYIPQYRVDINCLINIELLSLTPYETKAAKILYKK